MRHWRIFVDASNLDYRPRRDLAWQQGFRDQTIPQPALFIGGNRGFALQMLPEVDPSLVVYGSAIANYND